MRNDPAHEFTDEEIKRIEKEITKEYRQAHKEVTQKTKEYFKAFERKDKEWQELVKDGKVTEEEYIAWRRGQMLVGKRWQGLCDTLAEDYANTAQIAQSIAKEHAPTVYAVNHNYSTFECEKGSGMDTSYTLYSRESIERLYRENPKIYHNYGKAVEKKIKMGEQVPWDKKRVRSVLTQAVLQGESIPKITKRLEIVTGGDHKAAIRNARTMMTGVQNAGRIDAMKRANDLGIPTRKQWLATVDGRTRHWHRELDGVIKDIDEPFENEIGKIMFPADPDADGANVYNCRCTLLSAIKGFELDVTDPSIRPMPKLKDMTYDEWKASRKSESKPLTGRRDGKKAKPQKSQNIFGEAISYSDAIADRHPEAVQMIEELASEFKTKVKEVSVGSSHDKAGGITQISGTIMKVTNFADLAPTIHEFAHTISLQNQTKFGLYDESDFWKEIKKVRREYKKSVGDDSSKWISQYANKNDDEFFAEAFAHAIMHEKHIKLPNQYGTDFEYSMRVLEVVRKYFGKKR